MPYRPLNPLLVALLRFGLLGAENPFDTGGVMGCDTTLADEKDAALADAETGACGPKGGSLADEAAWQQLFYDARHQAVSALLYDAILMLPKEQRPPRRVLFHFTTLTQTIENDNARRHKALVAFADTLRQRLQLPAIVVKGSSLAAYYPKPLHRECGDNDLFTAHDTPRVASMLEADGVAVDRKDPRHISFSLHGVTFECHNYLLYRGHEPQWSPQPMAQGLQHLPLAQEVFFLAMHAEHHAVFFHQPLRLRTLLDWCMMLRSPQFHYDDLQALKKGSDVEVFADLLTAYCRQHLDVSLCTGAALNLHGVTLSHFEKMYLQCPQRHRLAVVRVARRTWKYIRYHRQYRAIYGSGMFRRFYLHNIIVALRNRLP